MQRQERQDCIQSYFVVLYHIIGFTDIQLIEDCNCFTQAKAGHCEGSVLQYALMLLCHIMNVHKAIN